MSGDARKQPKIEPDFTMNPSWKNKRPSPHAGKYAHTKPGCPPCEWQPLDTHLRNVADSAASFARPFGGEEWAWNAGLWHDLGKYSEAFQKRLRSQHGEYEDDDPGRVDHATAGAQHAVGMNAVLGHLLAYTIAGHHSGLLDGQSEHADLRGRLQKEVHEWKKEADELVNSMLPDPPEFVRRAFVARDAFCVAFFVRMLFSCLADADYLDTERFMDGKRAADRNTSAPLEGLYDVFSRTLDALQAKADNSLVNKIRKDVRAACEAAASLKPGLFSLTVPTGGGKTLAALAFSLEHAKRYGLRRIIYVAPFTSIIEQNADVFRRHLGQQFVLEHHCHLSPARETTADRLASENWDATVIVTTAVQFYESLFANRPGRCRKLHRIARSIIILDEAQTLPVNCLKPCLRVLTELAKHYGCSVVLSTATQPEISHSRDFEIGLQGVREIMPDPLGLAVAMQRVAMHDIGRQTDLELRSRIMDEDRVLCILNTTRHARLLFDAIGHEKGHFHLSARMCPAHRRLRLWQIRRALDSNQVCRVISTQVVEAGVDIDFPVVLRVLAGLDSITQAAGRCNRNGLLAEQGKMFVFRSEHETAERYFADTAQCAAAVMDVSPDPLSIDAVKRYFKLYYWDQKDRWDEQRVLDSFRLVNDRRLPLDFDFMSVSKRFRIIDDTDMCAVIVPWGRQGRALCERLRAMSMPSRDLLRQAQRYVVQVRRREWSLHAGTSITLLYENLGILESPELHYNEWTGLNLDAEGSGSMFS